MTLGGMALVLALAAGLASAQTNPAIEIHGLVTEIGSPLGVAGAEVTLYEFVRDQDRIRTVYATAATDTRGEFSFHPVRFGDYYVEVKKAAYVAFLSGETQKVGAPPSVPEITGSLISVSAEHPLQEVRFALMRPGELTGSVIDEDGKPVAGMSVQVAEAGYLHVFWNIVDVTNADGSFTSKKLPPGEYLVKISKPDSEFIMGTAQFPDDALNVVDRDWEPFYWPGAADQGSAVSIKVNPGASATLGTIRVRKTPSYRVKVTMGRGCRPSERASFSVVTPWGESVAAVKVGPLVNTFSPSSCEAFLVSGLKPGSYIFSSGSEQNWSRTPVEVTNRNLEIELSMNPTVDVQGRFVAADGVKLPAFDRVAIGSRTMVDSKGSFLLKSVAGPSKIGIQGLSNKYYVKELRVDGRTTPADTVVAFHQGMQVEIVLDDKVGTIAGTVTESGRPFPQPLIFVVKSPSLELASSKVTGDTDGRFQVPGLPPGEYRVLAVPSADLPTGMQIDSRMVEKLWSSAERVTLERGGSQSVSLKLSNPLR